MSRNAPKKRYRRNGKSNGNLPPRYQIFADEYLINDGRMVEAYLKAFPGVSRPTARSNGWKLRQDPDIAAYIEKERAELQERYKITRERIIQEEALIALSNPQFLFDENGKLLPLNKIPAHFARAIAGVTAEEKQYLFENGAQAPRIVKTNKYKLWDKGRALERIEKILGMYEKDNEQKRPSLQEIFSALQNISPELANSVKEHLIKNADTSD